MFGSDFSSALLAISFPLASEQQMEQINYFNLHQEPIVIGCALYIFVSVACLLCHVPHLAGIPASLCLAGVQ